ncbi:MAG: D-alanyl-D-alanine carboxypeptidase/D-alanyl-D-alanine-endopeptidase, partial [Phycisphaeraceae bacterium]
SPALAGAEIERRIETKIRSADLGPTDVSLFVYDLDAEEVLAQIDADVRMIPASNMKLVTTAAALINLGPDFVFRTELRMLPADGEADRDPSLLIHGDGDPAFGDPIILEQHGFSVEDLLDLWVDAVVDTGQQRFSRLIVDDRVFDHDFTHPSWPADQLIYRWCAPVAGLNFYQNVLDVLPQPTSWSRAPVVSLFPPEAARFLKTTNRATTGRTDSFWISRQGVDSLSFHGTVKNRRRVPVQVPLADPPLFLGQVMAERLRDRGIVVSEVVRPDIDLRLPEGKVLHRMRTTLPLVLERTNQDSQNMFAEALFKRMGRQVTGRPGGFDNGAASVRIAMQKLLGPRVSVLKVADGSGMSRDNRVTARFLVELLVAMREHPDEDVAEAFLSSLAVGGENGTLKRRFRTFDRNTDVLAKSGYLRGVSALSGYIVRPGEKRDGHHIAFAMLFNGFEPPISNSTLKKLQEEFLTLIEDATEEGVRLGG